MRKLLLVLAILAFASNSYAQRDLGARRLVLDNGGSPFYTLTLEASPLMTGNATFVFPPSGGSMPDPGTLDGQTLRWNSAGTMWQPSSLLMNTGTRLGINNISPQSRLHLHDTQTTPFVSTWSQTFTDGTGASGVGYYGGSFEVHAYGTNPFSFGSLIGASGRVASTRTVGNTIQSVIGTLGSIDHLNDGAITTARAVAGQIYNSSSSSGPITTASAFNALMFNASVITELNGLLVTAPVNTGTISAFNGVKIDPLAASTYMAFNYAHATDPATINADGKLTLGAAPSAMGDRLEIRSNSAATTQVVGTYGTLTLTPSGATTQNSYGLNYEASAQDGGTMNTRSLVGIAGRALGERTSGSVFQLIGTLGVASTSLSESHPNLIGLYGEVTTNGTGTMTNASAVLGRIFPGGGVITNGSALHAAQGSSFGGTIENQYGILIDEVSLGTTSNTALLYDHSTSPVIITGTGMVGIGSDDPEVSLDVAGALALRNVGTYTLVDAGPWMLGGDNFSYANVTAPVGGGGVSAIQNYTDGQVVVIYSTGPENLTIVNEHLATNADQRIHTLTGADIITSGEAAITLMYNSAIQRWIVTSVQD